MKRSLLVKKIVSGFVIGVGGIVPGVSGSIMAVSFGVYEQAIAAVANIFKQFKSSVMYLLPIGLGMLAGVFSMSNAIEWLMINYRVPVLFLFIGLVLGGLPSVVREGNAQRGFRSWYLIAVAIGFAVILLIAHASGGDVMKESTQGALEPQMAILSGAILAVGTLIPGISVSFLLIYMGVYGPLMSALNNLDIAVLALVGLGFVVVALLIVKLVQKLFEKHSGIAYYTILGFAIGSVVIIFPPVQADIWFLVDLLLLVVGVAVSYLMDRKRG